MKRSFFLTLLVLVIFYLSFRMVMSWKSDKKLFTRNKNISTQLENLELESILRYKRMLYSKSNSFQDIDEGVKLSLQYDVANYEIDLMPIIISNSVIICQTHSLKVLNNNSLYEYKCDEQIQCITYPKEEKKNLVFYIIKFDSKKNIYKVPLSERKWLLQKIIFREGSFIEETLASLDFPDSYYIKQLRSEISFFVHLNDFFYIALTNNNGDTAIYQFTKDGKMMNKTYCGYIMVPNRFSDSDLWYIRKDSKNKNFLIKNDNVITELNNYITQAHFVTDSILEFFGYDTSDIGVFDFINGSYSPFYFSEIYLLNENRFIDGYYQKTLRKSFIFDDKVRRDNILVIF